MSAVATQARTTPLIRRLPDADGRLVTYLPNAQLCETVDIAPSTLGNWTEQGLVRITERLNGGRNYAVVDAAKLKLMTIKRSQELGIKRTPERHIAEQRAYFERAQAETLPRAQFHGEGWDDYDLDFVVTNIAEGRTFEMIAKALGRSYSAVADVIGRLRDAGEILRDPVDESWRERVIEILTTAEVAALLAGSQA